MGKIALHHLNLFKNNFLLKKMIRRGEMETYGCEVLDP
jgi:hypothetical protein